MLLNIQQPFPKLENTILIPASPDKVTLNDSTLDWSLTGHSCLTIQILNIKGVLNKSDS